MKVDPSSFPERGHTAQSEKRGVSLLYIFPQKPVNLTLTAPREPPASSKSTTISVCVCMLSVFKLCLLFVFIFAFFAYNSVHLKKKQNSFFQKCNKKISLKNAKISPNRSEHSTGSSKRSSSAL
uniref:(northern house mosquito) hypothetical protein n=1 Tax=Culex pipiens TaxID=7175 RepID=A0A8D8NZS1_CULPI